MTGKERPQWQVEAPPGGWAPPWPQLVELVRAIPHEKWTLVGGLMVQLHAAHAGMQLTRPTVDVDMVIHIETGAATWGSIREQLEGLGYVLSEPVGDGPVHRFTRGPRKQEQVDVMVADHLPPSQRPRVLKREVFAVPGGTSALRKTVNCEINTDQGIVVVSVPDVLGALVLKGAAYRSDPRDRDRHLDDAAILACTVKNPVQHKKRMIGHDRSRVQLLWEALEDPGHRAWVAPGEPWATRGRSALEVLAANP
ncbi:Dephospho-CoA kinase/protein folding accessory domain-containing protein OS=Tsukamurella paurometabola(strain ATCC 8368 / DSM / CCUG 35730 / CIP 100753/ JCM 10117 / KCTC 9821 / NBRC 16120 / NCIMB 702349 / NCTC 13040) OX=521096 GN=Tpau_4265 PE=4 SV=1 [Tsukamurella paurometabola]|nr:nucleotidyl transferase AbiEii/AbiGii toxin family protein [Tsukamurella paurometabola]SUQ39189.1 Uncharacterised protein [Tsukamurella paurometabola]